MYQALYRQYRPKVFDQILGQEHITTTLKNQIKKENIGHAYLFSGTKGTGKTSTAKIFSRAVNCLNLQDGNPCNRCEVCKGILNESIMDVIEMDAASNRRIEDIRELREKVIYPPSRVRYKVYIIDEVHMLTDPAFNALLKTLEEPPKHLIFILATTEIEKLPQTILSRCQRFDFKRIKSEDIILNMKSICRKLNIAVEERALSLIARNSDGAMRDALSLLDQCISYKEELTYEDTLKILGLANTDLLFSMVDNIKGGFIEESLFTIDQIVENGKDINQFIRDIIYHFRNLLITKTSKDPIDIMDMDQEIVESYIEQSNRMSLDFILKVLNILVECEKQAKWATQPRITLEMAIIKMIKLEEQGSLEDRIKKLEMAIAGGQVNISKLTKPKAETKISDKNKVIREKETKQGVKQKARLKEKIKIDPGNGNDGKKLILKDIQNSWRDILNKVKEENIRVNAFLMEGRLLSFANNNLYIGYKDGFGFHKEAISRPDNKEFVENIISSYFNRNIKVRFIMDDEETTHDNKDNVGNIQEVIDFFGEDIVEIKE